MTARTLIRGLLLIAGLGSAADSGYRDFNDPPHRYFERTPTDRFTRLKPALESGEVVLDRRDELAFLRSLLEHLGIPISSQLLVFSTTSLQLSRITPTQPRALYFTDDLYLGYIPGGRLELVSLDPDLGAVFYIFDPPINGRPLQTERATRCMNCHAGEDTGHIPGLVVKSVAAGAGGGSLDAFRRTLTGHGVPLAERFGGWYLTGQGTFTNHWGNALGRFVDGTLTRLPLPPDERVAWDRYPRRTSHLLAHLLHEHQVGFVNRVVEGTYRARSYLEAAAPKGTAANGPKPLSPEQVADLEAQAAGIVRYTLFADEVPLPAGGVEGDREFIADFQKNRRMVEGISLKDLELTTRLFRVRCSYMVYTPVFAGLPPVLKERVYRRLGEALRPERPNPAYDYLPAAEKRAIRSVLRATLPDLPPDW